MPPQTPYGIDPLHFFIDLRVSGHIWDRKPPFGTAGVPVSSPPGLDCTLEKERSSSSSSSPHAEVTSSRLTELDSCEDRGPLNLSPACKPSLGLILGAGAKHNKHTSAFSVPEPRPLMMTTKNTKKSESRKKRPTINYVLHNLPRIYEELQKQKPDPDTSTEEEKENKEEEEKEEEKKEERQCKDLPALIGLELVVDYVKHEGKPGEKKTDKSPDTPAVGDEAPPQLAPSPTPEPEQAAVATP
jgi:hypothetical protein